MEYRISAEQRTFLDEVEQFVQQNWDTTIPVEAEMPQGDEALAPHKAFVRKLAERGWLTLAWPKEYGGLGADHMTQMLFKESIAYAGAPMGDGQGLGIIGPAIIVHGTPEQKMRFLPPIAHGEVYWCQGFSEPDAGSDLGNLQLRATRDGDDYILNGTKIWTTNAHQSDWIHLLARTDPDAPKHRGISYFLIDMKTPGITVRRIPNMAGHDGLNQTYFEDVRVPKDQMLGDENRGWYVATTTLDFERSSIGFSAAAKRTLHDLLEVLPREGSDKRLPASARVAFAEKFIETDVARWLSYRVGWLQSMDIVPNYEASIAKVYSTEMTQRIFNFGVNQLGLKGQLEASSKHAVLNGRIEYGHMWNVSPTIYGGTSEVQRNIIATRGLGLPRGA